MKDGFRCPELPWDCVRVVPLQLREGGPCQGTVASLQENEDTFQLVDTKVHCGRGCVALHSKFEQPCESFTCRSTVLVQRNAVATSSSSDG